MKFCPYCGSHNSNNNANFCEHCGAPIGSGNNINNNYNNTQMNNQKMPIQEGSTVGWGLLGFLVPLAGLVLWLVWNKERPKAAKSAGIGALFGRALQACPLS